MAKPHGGRQSAETAAAASICWRARTTAEADGSLKLRYFVGGEEHLRRPRHPGLSTDEALALQTGEHAPYSRRRHAEVGLDICLGRWAAMESRVEADESNVLPLQGRHGDATDGWAKHVPARIDVTAEAFVNTSERTAELFHGARVLRGVGGILERHKEVAQLLIIQFKRNERAPDPVTAPACCDDPFSSME